MAEFAGFAETPKPVREAPARRQKPPTPQGDAALAFSAFRIASQPVRPVDLRRENAEHRGVQTPLNVVGAQVAVEGAPGAARAAEAVAVRDVSMEPHPARKHARQLDSVPGSALNREAPTPEPAVPARTTLARVVWAVHRIVSRPVRRLDSGRDSVRLRAVPIRRLAVPVSSLDEVEMKTVVKEFRQLA